MAERLMFLINILILGLVIQNHALGWWPFGKEKSGLSEEMFKTKVCEACREEVDEMARLIFHSEKPGLAVDMVDIMWKYETKLAEIHKGDKERKEFCEDVQKQVEKWSAAWVVGTLATAAYREGRISESMLREEFRKIGSCADAIKSRCPQVRAITVEDAKRFYSR